MKPVVIHGCLCNPPGSGEEYCSGHCYLRAENERTKEWLDKFQNSTATLTLEVTELRAELEQANALTRVWKATAEQSSAENERLRAALRQILKDPDARILDSHRDEGWEALAIHKCR